MDDEEKPRQEHLGELVRQEVFRVRKWKAEDQQVRSELVQTKTKLQILIYNSNDAIFSTDVGRKITDCNPAFLSMFGYRRDEVIDRSVRFIHSSDESFNEFGRTVYPILHKAGSWRGEWKFQRKDQDLITLEVALSVQMGSDGDVLGYISVARDITERKRVEEALRKSEEKYRVTLRSTPDTVAISRVEDGLFLELNDGFTRMFGFSREEAIGKTVTELGLYLMPSARERLIEALTTNEEVNELEFTYRRKDGTHFVGMQSARPIRYGDNDCLISVVKDISSLKKAQRALKESEERYRNFVIHSSEGIYRIDLYPPIPVDIDPNEFEVLFTKRAEISEVNQSLTKMYGLTPSEMIGRPATDFKLGNGLRSVNLLDTGLHVNRTEIVDHDKNGRPIFLSLSFDVVIKDGTLFRIWGVVRDITERKLAEKEKEHLESQLRQAKKMEALGTLAGGIAHDFNNILSVIIGFSELALVEAENGSPKTDYFNEVIRAGEQAKELVTQILTFSRKIEPRLIQVDLNQLIKQNEKMLERTLPKMIKSEHHLADDLYPVKADQNQISQVLLNLGANAGDAMSQGGRLVIKTENVTLDQDYVDQHLGAPPGDYVLLTVSDTGPGMDEETLEHIFDPFFTKKEVGKGTGLGLSTVYGIVKSHSGHIICNSEVGQGTTFKIYLPAARLAEKPETIVEAVEGEIQGGDETILLVDDEVALRDLGRQTLSSQGYQVIVAETGEEALAIYRDRGADIDLIILDISMPGMGGHKCLQELLRINPQAKVVIASGYSHNGPLKDILSSGAAGFVPKPFSRKEMLKKVREVLDG